MALSLAATVAPDAARSPALGLPFDRSLIGRISKLSTVSRVMARPRTTTSSLCSPVRARPNARTDARRGLAARPLWQTALRQRRILSGHTAIAVVCNGARKRRGRRGRTRSGDRRAKSSGAFARSFTLTRDGDGRSLSLQFDASAVAEISARDLLEKIELIARALADRPELPDGELELVTAAARERLPDLSRPILTRRFETVAETFLRRAEQCPDAPAIVAAEGAYSYAELSRMARHIAARLLAAGVEPGDIVAISG